MAITNLTGTIWTFNDVIDFSSIQSSVRYNINLTTHMDTTLVEDVTSIYISQNSISYYITSFGADVQVYSGGSWYEGTDNITIEGGTDATNANLIAWLQSNATQYIEPHDIVISYGESTITMDSSGTEILETNGTFLIDDITIEYSKPVPAPYKDVNFYDDYDGIIVYSYSATEFVALTEMPPNPVHSGMISQGWNWTLADAKAQLTVSGYLSIGQMYVTSDGKTRAYITIPNNLRKTVRVNWNQSVAYSVSIDFGDGSAAVTSSGTGDKNAVHEYATCGDYIITLTVSSGTMRLGNGGNSTTLIQSGESAVRYPYCAMLRRLEIGSNVTDIRDNCLYNSFLLNALTIPNTVTTINGGAFYACSSLTHITIPSSCTQIKGDNTFRACRALYDLSLPKQATTVSSSSIFRDNQIINIALPNFTTITEYMLAIGGIITKMVIPSTVTSIAANAFNGNSGMKEYHFKSTTPPTLGDANAFTSIPSDCVIYVPTASLSTYQSATIWSNFSSYMVGE